jgi:hypothetical protein
MADMYAQGDLLIEQVPDFDHSCEVDLQSTLLLAEGELTGHRHLVHGAAALFRDDALSRDTPKDLYVGYLVVAKEGARIVHEEHGAIALGQGIYRVRRQREMEPLDESPIAD